MHEKKLVAIINRCLVACSRVMFISIDIDFYSIPGTPWCCSIMLLRDRCCSSLCMAAVNCEFSTYKSFTSKSEFVKRCACSLIIITWVSTVLRSSLLSLRCCCHDSVIRVRIVMGFFFVSLPQICCFYDFQYLISRVLYLRCIIDSVYCCCCFKQNCRWRFFCSSCWIRCIKLGCGVRCVSVYQPTTKWRGSF